MKSHRFFVVFFIVAVFGSTSPAQVPRTLSYQGVLTDSLGNPKPDGTYSFTFRLYETTVGGSPIWTEQKVLSVAKGLFHTILGSQVIIGPSLAFDRPYWLSIQVASDPELSPRMPLTASAYSITSIRSDTARFALTAPQQGFVDSARIAGTIPNNTVTTAKIVDGAITGAKIGSGQVVRRVNGIADGITIAAQGGATITSSNDTIIINAGSGGGGTGVQGVQNTNNTIDVVNPNGPTVTVNVKNSGITTTQLADNAVTSAKISDGTIQFADVGQNGAASGQVVKWNGTAWQPSTDNIGTGVFLPLSGGTVTGSISSTGSPSITMGKGNFGSGNTNTGTHAFVAGQNNTSSGYVASVAGGTGNSATQDYASIGGGTGNLASGISSHVGGGDGNTASGVTATVGGGLGNVASESYAVAGGGRYNQATGISSTVSGGALNKARGIYSVVSGGGGSGLADSNSALGDYSTIGGGVRNDAYGLTSTVSGGEENTASGGSAVVGGGYQNTAYHYSVVGGGHANEASGSWATVAGGRRNTASSDQTTVSGGIDNVASGQATTVSGGWANIASESYSVVGGGAYNRARGVYSVVGGGGWVLQTDSNSAMGNWSTIPGGAGNLAQGHYSFAAGRRAKALHDGSFAWGDDTNSDVVSDTTKQFKIRAGNGVNFASSAGAGKRIRLGDYYRDNANVAWGNINADGTVGSSFGVSSVVRNSAGNYTITLHVTTGNANTLIPLASAEVDGIPTSSSAARLIYVDQTNTTSFNVYITNGNFAATDNEFVFIATAR